MKIFREIAPMQAYLSERKSQGATIGFVPTMGALHNGHISLLEQCCAENDIAVVSIFVNPTQFNNAQDLEKYPRTEKQDIEILKQNQCDIVFIPTVQEIYPHGAKTQTYQFHGLDQVMEGAHRPGHFAGVATVVHALLKAVEPHRAYFGEKDYQQLRIIQHIINQLQLPVSIVPVGIMREKNGLAMSSRNTRLSSQMQNYSSIIFQTLQRAKEMVDIESTEAIHQMVEQQFKHSPLQLEYFSLADAQTLEPLQHLPTDKKVRAFIAAYADDVRLIDNMALN